MPWAKIDDRLFLNPKWIQTPMAARGLWVTALSYCALNSTGGIVSVELLHILGGTVGDAESLVASGLWEKAWDDYMFALDVWRIGDCRDDWDSLRATVAPLVFERDEYTCVYCGCAENLTVDHILPLSRGGDSEIDNLATACRKCNSSKGSMTPAEWRQI